MPLGTIEAPLVFASFCASMTPSIICFSDFRHKLFEFHLTCPPLLIEILCGAFSISVIIVTKRIQALFQFGYILNAFKGMALTLADARYIF